MKSFNPWILGLGFVESRQGLIRLILKISINKFKRLHVCVPAKRAKEVKLPLILKLLIPSTLIRDAHLGAMGEEVERHLVEAAVDTVLRQEELTALQLLICEDHHDKSYFTSMLYR
jgi:hypothetical protein